MSIDSAFRAMSRIREYLKLTMSGCEKSSGRPTEMCCAHLATNTPQSSLFSCCGMSEEGIAKYFQSCMSQFLPIIEAEEVKKLFILENAILAPAPLYRESKYIDIFSFMLTTTRHQCLPWLKGARMTSESKMLGYNW